jgi:hypothetical protein
VNQITTKERVNIEFVFENYDESPTLNTLPVSEFPTKEDFKNGLPKCKDFSEIFCYLSKGELPLDEKQAR